jgi:hypothetical protein
MLSTIAALLGVWAAGTSAQFVPSPTDLTTTIGYAGYQVRYKEVPTGICEQSSNVKSYSGYVDVSNDTHIFFWFFETRNGDPASAPLTTWLVESPYFISRAVAMLTPLLGSMEVREAAQ